MTDQATALRNIMQSVKQNRAKNSGQGARVVCVTSGKGGVGKTNFAVNLAISLTRKAIRVLIVDADFGLANVDVMMGVNPPYDLSHVLNGEKAVRDIIFEGPAGVSVISGGSGVFELINMPQNKLGKVIEDLLEIEDLADVVIFDTGAGVNPSIMRLINASEEVIVITTPEPTAIMDSYALIKSASRSGGVAGDSGEKPSGYDKKMRLVVNRAESVSEAHDTLTKFAGVVKLYLGVELEKLGFILNDPTVSRSVRLQKPFALAFPKAGAARNMEAITWRFLNVKAPGGRESSGLKGFFERFFSGKPR